MYLGFGMRLQKRFSVGGFSDKETEETEMPLPSLVKQLIEKKLEKYCQQKIPAELHDKIRMSYRIRGNTVTLIESRPYFRDPSIWTELKVAQFRYSQDDNTWSLYCADRNEKWHFYDPFHPSRDIDDLLAEVDRDPTGIFWG